MSFRDLRESFASEFAPTPTKLEVEITLPELCEALWET